MEILSEREKQVFFALHKIDTATAQNIAKETLINRTALYHTLGLLQKKGLVTPLKKDFTTIFQPIPLAEFEIWSKKRVASIQKELEEMTDAISKAKEQKSNLFSQIRYY